MIYLDCDTVEKNDIEAESDKIAGDILIPPAAYKAVLMGRVGKADYSEVPKLYRK